MPGPLLRRLALVAAAGLLAIAAPHAAAREATPVGLNLAEDARGQPARPVPPLSDSELGGITGRAGGPAPSVAPPTLPGVRLWDEYTPPAMRPHQDGAVTVNGVRVR